MAIKAVLFDFDGVIADALAHHFEWYRYLCEKSGKKFPFENAQGLVDLEEANHFASMYRGLGFNRETDQEAIHGWRAEYLNQKPFVAIDGIRDVVERLRDNGIKVGIASNNRKERVVQVLESSGMKDLFDVISCREEARQKRGPPQDSIGPALAALGANPKETLYVGDLPQDAKIGRKAGCRVALVPWGFASEEALANKQPDILAKTPGILLQKILTL